MLLFQQIEELAYKNTDSRRNIGEFLLTEKGNLEKYSMQEIAEATFTSKASLVRFAKTLGYKGWKEFMTDFLAEIHYNDTHYNDIDPNLPFTAESSRKDIVYQIANLQVESILDTADLIDMHQLDKAVGYLKAADKIAIFGLAPNSYVAKLFQRKMLTIGKYVMLSDSGNHGMLAYMMGENDTAILISYSGNNPAHVPVNLLPILKENHVRTIGITGKGGNTISSSTDAVLIMSTREKLYSKIANFGTEESINYILNVLFACCFQEHYDDNLVYKIKVSQAIENRVSDNPDIRE